MSSVVRYEITDLARMALSCFSASNDSGKRYLLLESFRGAGHYPHDSAQSQRLRVQAVKIFHGTNKKLSMKTEIVYGVELGDSDNKLQCLATHHWTGVMVRVSDQPFSEADRPFEGFADLSKMEPSE